MKIALVVLAAIPLAFSACKHDPTNSATMGEATPHPTSANERVAPGMMGSPGSMAESSGTGTTMGTGITMAGGAHMAAPTAAMAGAGTPSRSMGATSKRTMKMASEETGHMVGTHP
jgi:hypothetical protein